jgi:hypothetical protein
MKHRLYITRHIFITYIYELKGENHLGSFFIPPQALSMTFIAYHTFMTFVSMGKEKIGKELHDAYGSG